MNLEKFGYNDFYETARLENGWQKSEVARVISDCREIYTVQKANETFQAQLTGRFRFTAESRMKLPAIGDWVAIKELSQGEAIIHGLFPRKTVLARMGIVSKDFGASHGGAQIIAANVDTAFIVMAANRDFNLNRLDRYLALTFNEGINAVVVMNKADLIASSELEDLKQQILSRHPFVKVIESSAISKLGLDRLEAEVKPGKTFCFVGSSGVGKSTLINYFAGKEILKTQEIGGGTSRGKHTTTKREMLVLENGSLLIDTPGMRLIGMTEADVGLSSLYDDIEELILHCRFNDCKHAKEPGCKVMEALETGDLCPDKWKNYQKLQRETQWYQRSASQKRQKAKTFAKQCAKIIKNKKSEKFG